MYNQPEIALENYELNTIKISKGRSCYICDTDCGTKALFPFRGLEGRAQTIRDTLVFLKNQGIDIEQIELKRDGSIITKDNCDTSYILKDYKQGRECDPDIISDMCQTMKTLAEFHRATEKYIHGKETNLMYKMQKKCNGIIKLKNYIKHKNKINEFEELFNKEYEHFLNQGMKAVNIVENVSDVPIIFCHGNFNHHNIICDAGKWHIINLETMTLDYPQIDIAEYMRKMLEKNGWSVELGKLMTESYESVRKMSDDEKKLLGAMLLFPEKFCKITNQYINSRKTWISGKSVEKLKVLAEQDCVKEIFLRDSIF